MNRAFEPLKFLYIYQILSAIFVGLRYHKDRYSEKNVGCLDEG
jgi:hypothetical protein